MTQCHLQVLYPAFALLVVASAITAAADEQRLPTPSTNLCGEAGKTATTTVPATVPATQPTNATFADPGDARQIIFICDASGSMINKFESLKVELNKAIAALQPGRTFNIVVLQDGVPAVLNRTEMVPASLAGKQAAKEFLAKVTASPTTDPMPGLAVAFRHRPDLVYLLTDGDFPDNDAVLKKVRSLNRKAIAPRPATIHTIAFTNVKDTDDAFLKLLRTIAEENGGTFRQVLEDHLRD
jgi:hypothetical protein